VWIVVGVVLALDIAADLVRRKALAESMARHWLGRAVFCCGCAVVGALERMWAGVAIAAFGAVLTMRWSRRWRRGDYT
jgi:hypothetical protein